MSNHTSWHITHLKKKFFWKSFLGFFVNFLCCTSPNSKKIYKFWKPQSLAYLKPLTFFRFVYFSWFCCNFWKKIMTTKIFFSKNFFFNFWKSPFLSIIRRDLTKKKFWKFQKKIFKKNFFFQMWNESTCVIRHKSKLYETKPPHLRNTWIAFLWPKCLYYCHINQSKYKS